MGRFPAREVCRKNAYKFGTIFPLGIIALVLSGCATTRYVTIHCVTPEQYQKLKDAEPPRVGDKLTGQAQDDLKTIAGSTVELRTYSEGLLGVLGGCVGN
jgi:hypothetical protein